MISLFAISAVSKSHDKHSFLHGMHWFLWLSSVVLKALKACGWFFILTLTFFQAMFASFIPEIMDILGTRSKYGGSYKKEHGKRYGCITLL